MKRVWMILAILGYYAAIIFAGFRYGFKASVLVIIASCCTAFVTTLVERNETEEKYKHENCDE